MVQCLVQALYWLAAGCVEHFAGVPCRRVYPPYLP